MTSVRQRSIGPAAPAFRSARLDAVAPGSGMQPRRLGRAFSISLLIHAGSGAGLLLLWLLSVDPLPGPPIVVRFFAHPPPPPRLVPPREPPARAVKAPPPVQPESAVPALRLPPAPPRRPQPPPLEVRAETLKLTPVEADLPPAHDVAPPLHRASLAMPSRVEGTQPLPAGTGSLPELELLVPGARARRGPGDGLAGRGDGLPALPAGEGSPGAGGGRDSAAGDGDLRAEPATAATGLASFLGRKYGAVLVEAARLGQRTNDGPRYSLLVPMLSEAYRSIHFRGLWRAPGGGTLLSVRVDADAVAIRYRDGTLHVIVPTRDGLVALFVSADPHAGSERSKVDEAERALQALRRLAGTGA